MGFAVIVVEFRSYWFLAAVYVQIRCHGLIRLN